MKNYTCNLCSKVFESRGKPRFCSAACSNKFRFQDYKNPDEEKAIKMYKGGMTIQEVAAQLNISYASIRRAFKRNNLTARKFSESYKIRRAKIPFSYLQEQLILGSLLGDACLYEDNYKSRTTGKPCITYRLAFGHSIKQIDYLLLKHTIMNRPLKIQTRVSGHGAIVKYFTYTDGPRLENIASKCLHNGQKKVTTAWLDALEPTGLAFWYQDDGSYVSNENVIFCTDSYSRLECDNIIFKLASLGIKAGLNKRRTSHRIRLYKASIPYFFDMIKTWVVPSMAYKIGKV